MECIFEAARQSCIVIIPPGSMGRLAYLKTEEGQKAASREAAVREVEACFGPVGEAGRG